MSSLGDFERDVICELLNIGMGRAAGTLSKMMEDEIKLSVPYVDLIPLGNIGKMMSSDAGQRIAAVRQPFDGAIRGDALLVFPESHSLEIVRSVVRDHVPIEYMTDLERDAMIEVGNIVLNGCLGSLANVLGDGLCSHLPRFVGGTYEDVLKNSMSDPELGEVLFLLMEFSFDQKLIRGHVVFLINIQASHSLNDAISKYVSSLGLHVQQ